MDISLININLASPLMHNKNTQLTQLYVYFIGLINVNKIPILQYVNIVYLEAIKLV